MHLTHWTLVAIIIAYLLGSIATSVIVCKIAKKPDPREEGSKNPGATNVLRLAGKKPALFTLIGDMLKGVVAILIGRILGQHGFNLSLVAIAVYLGHVFPIFYKFKGGKGVATGFGAILMMSPLVGIVIMAVWAAVAAVFRYSSLAALVAFLVAPFLDLFVGKPTYFIGLIVLLALVYWRHWGNIERLRAGTEPKIGKTAE